MASSDAGPGGAPQEQPGVPASVLRSWDEAEARLFPLVMAQPELYQQALGAVQRLLGQLRETCHDLPALLAAHERGGDPLAGDEAPSVRPRPNPAAARAPPDPQPGAPQPALRRTRPAPPNGPPPTLTSPASLLDPCHSGSRLTWRIWPSWRIRYPLGPRIFHVTRILQDLFQIRRPS